MTDAYPAINNIIKTIGLKAKEKVLILTDRLADKRPIELMRKGFSQRGSEVKITYLPIKLGQDFPIRTRKIIRDFDVIFLAASQSWYQAPTRKKAKYKNEKRVIECYGLTLEMLKSGALCADYKKVKLFTKNYKKKFKAGATLTIKTELGTNFSAVIKEVFDETGCYDKPATGGNLPAGEISLGIEKETFNGEIVFDVSFDILGRLKMRHLAVSAKDGKVVKVRGRFRKRLEALFRQDKRLHNIAEIGIGTNDYAILGRSVLEDEKKLGTAHIGFGNDTYFGGNVCGPHLDGVFLSPIIIINGKVVK